ncbi:MAG: ClpXP protease specificity-enhancing factor SspB [Pseudolabrys sp.]|nr:ClpXP protease specificity-enhancing factor SspB [Pseudolabrys sp.]
MADHIRYDLLTQQALRGVVRNVLTDAAKKGLPGDHHFYISFKTQADNVRMSDRLRAQYPEEMTVILQHQFWDLAVTEQGFEVGMSFGGIPEKLAIPFDAISGFFDPSVQFGLQFEAIAEGEEGTQDAKKPDAKKSVLTSIGGTETPAKPAPKKPEQTTRLPVVPPAPASVPTLLTPVADATEPTDPDPDKPSGGGEVVRLDRFRKK